MNISHSRFILFKLKIFGEIVTTKIICWIFEVAQCNACVQYTLSQDSSNKTDLRYAGIFAIRIQ